MNIDHIFYINLDKRVDRDNNVRSQLNKHNLLGITERVSAVNGSTLNLDTIPETIITSKGILDSKSKTNTIGISLTSGAIGCALSHRKIWINIRDDPNIQSAL
jgi:GR25 family glycosyltransferase involved in LPS biosynthesis